MEATATFEQLNRKPQALQPAQKRQINTGYYDLLAQMALNNKRRQQRQA